MAGSAGGHAVATAPGFGDLIALVNIGIVVAIIVFAGKKGIKAFLKNRADELSKGLVLAKEELDATLKQIQSAREQIADVEGMKAKMIAQVTEEGERLSKQIVAEAQVTAARILADARLAVGSELSSATKTLRTHLVQKSVQATLAQMADEKNNSLKGQLHQRLVEGLIEDLNKSATTNGRYVNGH